MLITIRSFKIDENDNTLEDFELEGVIVGQIPHSLISKWMNRYEKKYNEIAMPVDIYVESYLYKDFKLETKNAKDIRYAKRYFKKNHIDFEEYIINLLEREIAVLTVDGVRK